jgi:GR25 family glycosyltransferase involved in LPS biosynthesis
MTTNIDHIFFINLDKRVDRKELFEAELAKYELTAERFAGIYYPPPMGIVGCGKSHLQVLELAKLRKYKNVLICEDDFYFTEPKQVVEDCLQQLFTTKPDFDVCFLAQNLISGTVDETNPLFTRVTRSISASGYIVNAHYYDKLIELYDYAMPLLEQTNAHWIYANDVIWKSLQETDNWHCFTKPLGRQRDGISDTGDGKTVAYYDC